MLLRYTCRPGTGPRRSKCSRPVSINRILAAEVSSKSLSVITAGGGTDDIKIVDWLVSTSTSSIDLNVCAVANIVLASDAEAADWDDEHFAKRVKLRIH